jgi:hypothetical protein
VTTTKPTPTSVELPPASPEEDATQASESESERQPVR